MRVVPTALVAIILLARASAQAGTDQGTVLRVEGQPTGEIELEARGATIEATLRAIGSEAGFDVLIDRGIVRPPVNIAPLQAPVEELLRQILRGRNHALVYAGDEAAPSHVILLPPPAPGRGSVPRRPFRRR